jgi:hypothetical protein
MLVITPVVEVPWIEEGLRWPWAISQAKAYTHVPLQPSPEGMGTFMAALCAGEYPLTVDAGLILIREANGLIASGGMSFSRDAVRIEPACCCGLESWTEWREFLQSGASPWMGHSPDGWAELAGDQVTLWTDGTYAQPSQRLGPSISVERAEFEIALALAEQHLFSFFAALPVWFESVGRADAKDVIEKIHREFQISR